MHRSRFSTLLIDTPHTEAAEAVSFWTNALGSEAHSPEGEPQFTGLDTAFPGLVVAVQSIGTDAAPEQPRFHVDIETDDLGAEVSRLEALGAVEISQWLDCHTLRAPSGHLLCVIPVHSDPAVFEAAANVWP